MAAEHLIDIDRETGELISGWARIKQSIRTILTTRLRWRIMRLWWGSEFLDMQDKPANSQTFTDGIIAAVTALNAYEPEFRVTRIIINELDATGSITITAEGIDLVDQATMSIKTVI